MGEQRDRPVDPKGRSEPGFQRHVFVCTNQRSADNPRGCCHDKGGAAVAARFKAAVVQAGLKGAVRSNSSGCLDFCEHGPCVVVYPEAVWYTIEDLGRDVDEIVDRHLVQGEVVERCRMKMG
jgi:(2Fe-2S) ferredoxin